MEVVTLNLNERSLVEQLMSSLQQEDKDRSASLFDCLFSKTTYVPPVSSLYTALVHLHSLYKIALKIQWSDFDRDKISSDEKLIAKLIASLKNQSPSDLRSFRLNQHKTQVKYYPVFVSLVERYDLVYKDDELHSIQLVHFVLFARRFYQSEQVNAAAIDFFYFVSNRNQFEPIILSENMTQEELIQRYQKLRNSIILKNNRTKLRARLFRQSSTQKVISKTPNHSKQRGGPSSKKIELGCKSSVLIEEQEVYYDEQHRQRVQTEQAQRVHYPTVCHHTEEQLTLEQVRIDLILGSRLSLLDSLHLPLSTQYLRDDEANDVINKVTHLLNHDASIHAAVTLLMLLTAKSSSVLETLLVTTSQRENENTTEYIDLEQGSWSKPSIVLNDAFSPSKEQAKWLMTHNERLSLPLPAPLVAVLKWYMQKRNKTHCLLRELVSEGIEQSIKTVIKGIKSNRPLNSAKLRSYLFLKIAYRYDAQTAMALLNAFEFDNTHHLYYLAESEDRLLSVYREEVSRLFGSVRMGPEKPQSLSFIGSKNTLNSKAFRTRLKYLHKDLKKRLKVFPTSVDDLRSLWNDLNCYCALMSVASSNHRIRQQYTFTSNSLDIANGRILVSDKYHHNDSAIRVLPMANELKEQLTRFNCWKERLSAELALCGESVSKQKLENGEIAYFTVFSEAGIVPLGHTHLSIYLGEDWSLPLNVLRHKFCQMMRDDRQARKWAKGFMGHVNSGQHHLSHYSLLSLNDLDVVKPALSASIINELAFELLPQFMQKKEDSGLSTATHHEIMSVSMSDIIKWVRHHIEPNWVAFKKTSDLEKLQKLVFQQMMQSVHEFVSGEQVESVIYIYQRFFVKLSSRLELNLTTQYGLVIEEENLTISSSLLSDQWLAQSTKEQLKKYGLMLDLDKPTERLACVILRTLAYSALAPGHTLDDFVNALVDQNYFIIDGAMYVVLSEFERQYLDPISITLLLASLNDGIIEKKGLKSLVNQQIKRAFDNKAIKKWVGHYQQRKMNNQQQTDVFKKDGICTYDAAILFFRQQHWPYLSSVLNAYHSENIHSHSLSNAALTRLFTSKRYFVEQKESHQHIAAPILLKNMDREHIEQCLKQLSLLLVQLPTMPSQKQLGQCVVTSWQQAVKKSSDEMLSLHSLRERSINEFPLVVAMSFEYLYQVSQRRGKCKERNISINTISNYKSIIIHPILTALWNVDIESLDYEDFEEAYTLILSIYTSKKSRQHRANLLRDFHQTCQKVFNLPRVRWHLIEPSLKEDQLITNNANILTYKHYCDALTFIKNESTHSESQRQQHCLMLILCYRAGLRPSEAWALSSENFTDDLRFMTLKTNKRYRLKSSAANRQIPLHLFLNEDERNLLKEKVKQAERRSNENWLFYTVNDSWGKHACTSYLTKLVKYITADNTIRLYHCRHSFANYLFLILINSKKTKLSNELQQWTQTRSYDELSTYRDALLSELVGDPLESYKGMFALAKIMGHKDPQTTLSYYIHTLDIQLYIEQARTYFDGRSKIKSNNIINRNELEKWSDLNTTAFKKALSREKSLDGKYATIIKASPECKKWEIEHLDNILVNKENNVNTLDVSEEHIFDNYLQINKLLHKTLYKECHNQEIEDAHEVYNMFNYVSDSLKISLFNKSQNGKNYFTNNINLSALVNYHQKPAVFTLLNRFSMISSDDKQKLLSIFMSMNHSNSKYIFTEKREIEWFCKILELNYTLSDSRKKVKLNNRLEEKLTISFFLEKEKGIKSINQQLAYVFIIVAFGEVFNS